MQVVARGHSLMGWPSDGARTVQMQRNRCVWAILGQYSPSAEFSSTLCAQKRDATLGLPRRQAADQPFTGQSREIAAPVCPPGPLSLSRVVLLPFRRRSCAPRIEAISVLNRDHWWNAGILGQIVESMGLRKMRRRGYLPQKRLQYFP